MESTGQIIQYVPIEMAIMLCSGWRVKSWGLVHQEHMTRPQAVYLLMSRFKTQPVYVRHEHDLRNHLIIWVGMLAGHLQVSGLASCKRVDGLDG